MYTLLSKKKLAGFYFSVISWFLGNSTYHRSMFIALVYAHSYELIFHLTELSNYCLSYKNMNLHVLHVRSYALVVLLANCHVDTLH